MRARLLAAALCAGVLTLGRATPARAAADSVLVRVGGELSARQGDYVDVPVTVDLRGAPGRSLGSYRATLSFNPGILEFEGANTGNFAQPQYNADHASDSGLVRLTAILPAGATGVVTIFVARFYVLQDTAQSPVTVALDEMSATATSVTPFESLLPLLRIVNGTFCRSLGKWGDADGDGQANSLDALIALSAVVGMPVDTTLVKPALTDVDADGLVTSRDALIILSYAVGLPVSGYRVLQPAAGACATGNAITLAIAPDSLELQAGQSVPVLVTARDASGRAVPVDSLTWVSSNPAVAALYPNGSASLVQGRSAGIATLTARLGALTGTMKVSVIAHRLNWFVDVERARNTPTQVGTQDFPLEYMGDALSLAHDGDTVRVASGVYEEMISAGTAVVLIGDSIHRPVLDPRGAPDWYSYYNALDLEPNSGLLAVTHLVVRAGMVYLSGHDIAVRDVDVAMLGGTGTAALELVSGTPGGDAPPARAPGPQRANAPAVTGSVLVDNVTVSADSTGYGILVDLADTAVIRNSSVTRSSTGNPSCGPGPYINGGILVRQASVSVVRNNVVTNADCQGIAVFNYRTAAVAGDIGRATISQNRVTGSSTTGIAAGARLVALDHNLVQGTGVPGYRSYGSTAGVHVIQLYGYYGYVAPDSVTSLGDTVLNSGGHGFVVDTAGAAVLDSMVVNGTGQDSSGYAEYGVDLERGGRFTLSHSRIANTVQDNAVNVMGARTVFRSHGNHVVDAGYNGISVWPGNCECSDGPDTLISVADTVLGANDDGIFSGSGDYTFVDSLVVDSTGYDGVEANSLGRLLVQNSRIRRTSNAALDGYSVDHFESLRNRLLNNFGNGLYLEQVTDSALIYGNVVDTTGSGWSGLWMWGSVNVLVDSSRITNGGNDGIQFEQGSGGRVLRSRIEGNQRWGVSVVCCGYDSVVVRQSTIRLNLGAGAMNQNTGYGAVLDADSSYWGDPNGPTCAGNVSGCNETASGDLIGSLGVMFADWLTSPPVTPAPPFRALVTAGAGVRSLATRVAGSPAMHHGAVRHGSAALRPEAVRAPRAPRSAAVGAAATGSVLQRPPHRQAPAWHAPSKARSRIPQAARQPL